MTLTIIFVRFRKFTPNYDYPISRMPRRASVILLGIAQRGAARKPRFAKGTGKSLLANPDKIIDAQETSGIRVAFSLDTFFWRSKRKYLDRGYENPH
jgi:hypothetical protein